MPDQNKTSPYALIGGEATLDSLVEAFYGYVKNHSDLTHLFPDDLTETKDKQKKFLTQFFGGPQAYTEEYGHPRLRLRHMPFVISPVQADAWLACMEKAMDDVHLSGDIREFMMQRLTLTAHHMVNHASAPR
ncbi:LOW QUALITY PROTEIN: hemoglobin-like protein HbO [Bacillus sp. JCM 19047]|nr:LOW QUALITY PROTEIN: hemoglobin-like protein HbO [Bacillus sp. JCM 19047]